MKRDSPSIRRWARALAGGLAIAVAASDGTFADDAPAAPHSDNERTSQVVTTDRTDAVIDGALRFLAGQQLPNGSWEANQHQAAVTAYVMVAFMAAGNLPDEGPYARQMGRGLQFLLGCVRPNGYIAAPTGESNMYGHGIATIVLAELYGQTRDPQIRPRLQSAIKLIIDTQNDAGGWRYQPRKADADISVTVLQVVALRSAKNAGIDVPQKTIDKAVQYVKSCYDKNSGGFCYQPNQSPGFARTAAAIYSLQVCGLYDDEQVRRGSSYLTDKLGKDRQWFAYGNFYAAPAQYMIGGKTWEDWYARMSRELLAKVRRNENGVYWEPENGQGVSQVYTTAVYATILAMPYHYIPLYQR